MNPTVSTVSISDKPLKRLFSVLAHFSEDPQLKLWDDIITGSIRRLFTTNQSGDFGRVCVDGKNSSVLNQLMKTEEITNALVVS